MLKKKFKGDIYAKFRIETWLIAHKSHTEIGEDSDIIFPNNVVSEKVSTFINTEGRPQTNSKLFSFRSKIREDWSILRAISTNIGNSMRYNTFEDIKKRMSILLPMINSPSEIEANKISNSNISYKNPEVFETRFISLIEDFYLTDLITRSSKIMLECSDFLRKENTNFQ
jgi:NADH dehydrogenase/NADH:ubiquinone oxidoreductase subunit G